MVAISPHLQDAVVRKKRGKSLRCQDRKMRGVLEVILNVYVHDFPIGGAKAKFDEANVKLFQEPPIKNHGEFQHYG